MLHPSYQSILAEFSRLLSMYIVFLGRASLNWAVDCPGLVLFLTGPAHDDNGAQTSSRYQILASGPPALVIFCLTTSARSFFTESNTQPSSIFLLKRHVLLPFSNLYL